MNNDIETYWNTYCKDYKKIPYILPKQRRIVVIGDIHGDLFKAIESLKIAKVINDKLEWIGQDTVIVQVGDQVDRCRPLPGQLCGNPNTTLNDEASDIKILKLFTDLNKKAEEYGGRVISLLGNHELMNVMGQMDYVSYKGLEQFKDYGTKSFEDYVDPNEKRKFQNTTIPPFNDGLTARKHAFKPGNEIAKYLACTRVAAVIIGGNLFAHAGVLPEIAQKYGVGEIDLMISKWLLDKLNNSNDGITNIDNLLNNKNSSPFWQRFMGTIPIDLPLDDYRCQKYVANTLKLMNVGHIIVGHTPQFYANFEGINGTCDDALWRVDVGFSKAFDAFSPTDEIKKKRDIQVLEILDDNKFNVIKAT